MGDKITLGQRVRDTVSGFEGIAVVDAEHIHGCNRIGIRPQELNESGEPVETHFFDEPRVEVLGEGMVEQVERQNAEVPAAGAASDPSGRPDPK